MTVTGRSETSQPGLTHFLQTPLLNFKQRNAPLREEEGRGGGAIVSLQCQLAERERRDMFAFIWPVVVFMISLRGV